MKHSDQYLLLHFCSKISVSFPPALWKKCLKKWKKKNLFSKIRGAHARNWTPTSEVRDSYSTQWTMRNAQGNWPKSNNISNIPKLQSAGGKLTANLEQKWIVGIDQNASKMSLSFGKNFFFRRTASSAHPLITNINMMRIEYVGRNKETELTWY